MQYSINSSILKISFGLVILFQSPTYSQNKIKADSLLQELSSVIHSKDERLILLLDIAYYHPNIDSALLLANQSLILANEIKSPLLKAQALEEISNTENRLGNNHKSSQASYEALRIYETLGMFEKQAASYAQLANNYMHNKEYNSAIVYLKKAKKIYIKSNLKENQIYTILNMGEMYRLAGHLDSAKTNFKQVLKLNELLKDDLAQGYALGNLGMIYTTQGGLSLAKIHMQNAIDILTKLGDPYATSVYLAELGEVYQKENKPKVAEENYLEALSMAQEAGLKEQIRDFSEKLTRFYETQGDYAQALHYQKQFQIYQDSLVNKTNIQEIERIRAGYEIDKRESQIGLLNTLNTKQKYLLWTLSGGVLAILIFLYWIFKVNNRVKKANIRLTEQKEIIGQREREKVILLQELNHRVKNNLQMISSLLSLQSRELVGHPAQEALEAGKDRVEALSLVHRKLYQEGVETRIALKEYLEELVLGLFHGYNAHFEPKFELADTNISVDTAVPLALIVNELVVNALKYAYDGVNYPSLTLKMDEVDLNLTIQIIDNGKGFTINDGEKKNSFGLKLIRSLTEQLEGTIKKIDKDGTHWKLQLRVA